MWLYAVTWKQIVRVCKVKDEWNGICNAWFGKLPTRWKFSLLICVNVNSLWGGFLKSLELAAFVLILICWVLTSLEQYRNCSIFIFQWIWKLLYLLFPLSLQCKSVQSIVSNVFGKVYFSMNFKGCSRAFNVEGTRYRVYMKYFSDNGPRYKFYKDKLTRIQLSSVLSLDSIEISMLTMKIQSS